MTSGPYFCMWFLFLLKLEKITPLIYFRNFFSFLQLLFVVLSKIFKLLEYDCQFDSFSSQSLALAK